MPVRQPERIVASRKAIKTLEEEYEKLYFTSNPLAKTMNQADATPYLESMIPLGGPGVLARAYELDTMIETDPLALKTVWRRLAHLAKIIGYDYDHIPRTIQGLAQMERLLLPRSLYWERKRIRQKAVEQYVEGEYSAQTLAFCKVMLKAMDNLEDLPPLAIVPDLSDEAGPDADSPWLPEDDYDIPEDVSANDVVEATKPERAYLRTAEVDEDEAYRAGVTAAEAAERLRQEAQEFTEETKTQRAHLEEFDIGRWKDEFDQALKNHALTVLPEPQDSGPLLGDNETKRVNLNLPPRTVQAVEYLRETLGWTQTDALSRGAQLIADAVRAQEAGGGAFIQEKKDAAPTRVRLY